MRTTLPLITGFCLALSAAASGCVVVQDPGPPPPPLSPSYGTLTATWALNGSASASACAYYAIDRVDIVVSDAAGYVTAVDQPFCEDLAGSFVLTEGVYTTELTLLDLAGRVVSDTVIVDAHVLGDAEVVIDANFPDAWIY